ncbi:putative pantothenate kinase [Helianthus annuus]|uniref:Pantothenate kinase n=1 Tax=Helianthus annuus TaxID=4232 RepID=A0A9K3HRP7_HELAN|nr:putative pantothenate kinase [Helianthus annuus]KAJ0502658.1 putative pantothenate kinase [Helianthus annuus]KAJ0518618.1 putative pantothenate kinase [Helianthus annuus]KAJ0686661.1 putative pantothenate kinase [Helianthus annuus]KAJ0690474.1 putative pantothenate kinase [Helianthus annuus]
MLPLARELLRRGTEHCDILRGAAEAGGLLMDAMSNTQDNPSEKLSSTPLMVVENVCGRPCIDLRQVRSALS